MFQVGPKDADSLGKHMGTITSDDLRKLDKFVMVTKMQLFNKTLPPFTVQTLPPLSLIEDLATPKEIRQASRFKYARHREVVDKEIFARFDSTMTPEPAEEKHEDHTVEDEFADLNP